MEKAAGLLLFAFAFVAALACLAVFPAQGARYQAAQQQAGIALQAQAVQPPPAPLAHECDEGEKKECTSSNGCAGEAACNNGVWSPCSVERVCRPGRVAPCPLDSCNFGLRACNECGSGWGECAYGGSG